MVFINLTIINIVFEAMDTGKWKKKILVHNSRTYRKFRRNLKGKKKKIKKTDRCVKPRILNDLGAGFIAALLSPPIKNNKS